MSTEDLKKALKICITGCDYCYNCPYRQWLEDENNYCADRLHKDIVQLIEQK